MHFDVHILLIYHLLGDKNTPDSSVTIGGIRHFIRLLLTKMSYCKGVIG